VFLFLAQLTPKQYEATLHDHNMHGSTIYA